MTTTAHAAAQPTTSFVVTCHNLGQYLDDAVSSILAQTVRDLEIVVVNDGSTDALTCRVLADYARDRTRVVHGVRRGLPGARNFGVTDTSGRFLCMVDADDMLEPTYLERSLSVLDARPELAFASHWLRAFGEESWEWTPTDCSLESLLLHNTVNGAALIRREAFEAIGGFDESMVDGCEDWELWIRAVEAGFEGTIIPEFLFRYRRRSDSMSRAMHTWPGMAGLYRQLVERHPEAFARHLTALLASRDEEIRSVSTSLWQLEAAWAATHAAGAQWSADNVQDCRAVMRESGRDDEMSTAKAHLGHLMADNRALRESWSWRVTAPLRAALGWVRR